MGCSNSTVAIAISLEMENNLSGRYKIKFLLLRENSDDNIQMHTHMCHYSRHPPHIILLLLNFTHTKSINTLGGGLGTRLHLYRICIQSDTVYMHMLKSPDSRNQETDLFKN